jgi:hypothetical protein
VKNAIRIVFLAVAFSMPLAAQQVRGTITDSTTRQPVSGAIVMLLDSAGTSIVRTIADEMGVYILPVREAARRVRVQRLGFRPLTVALPATRTALTVNIAIMPIAAYLEAVGVSASACGSRPDRGSAIALFDQARNGLLATIVAREANPARMVLYGFERTMDGTSDRIIRQTVRVDSAASARVAFSAAASGLHLVDSGFVQTRQWGRVFLAPDADVLLGEQFATGYCFGLARPQPTRPNQLGIAFSAARSRRGRIDIEGALWLDTLRRTLVDLEFNYVGMERREELLRPGGRVEFREMPNGAVLVDRWTLRLLGMIADSIATKTSGSGDKEYDVRTKYYAAETGGELARARWRDGREWKAPLATLRIKANHGDRPAVGAVLALDETPYRGTVNIDGELEFTDIIPGPYKLVSHAPAFAEIGVTIPTSLAFTASRASLHRAEVTVPTAREFIYQRCVADKFSDPKDSTRILVRAMTHTGEPLDDVSWKVSRRLQGGAESGTSASLMTSGGHLPMMAPNKSGPGVSLGAYRVLRDGGRTGTDGMFQLCVGGLYQGTQLLIQASRPGYEDVSVDARLTGALQVIRLNMVPRQ